ncbi:MAG: cache domain-containing protein [Candidatus Rifleibacteriota bacterium]
MLLKTKVRLTITIMLIIAIIAPMLVTGSFISTSLNRELKSFEEEAVDNLREQVKNFVDLGYGMLQRDYQMLTDKASITRLYGQGLKDELDIVAYFLKLKAEEVEKGVKTLEQAQYEAKETVRNLRLQNGENYVWIQDTGRPLPKMIEHPLVPELNGKILDDEAFNCARGKGENLFVAAVEVSGNEAGGGFIDYIWPKMLKDGTRIPSVAKISFVKLIPEWNWIIGTGIYIDDAIRMGIESMRGDISRIRYNGGAGFFWLHDETGRLICHGNEEWIQASAARSEPGAAIKISLEMLKKGQQSGFFEFKGTIEEFTREEPRIGCFKFFEPLGWVIGTSISRSEIDQKIAGKREQIKAQTRRVFIFGFLFFMIFCGFSLAIVSRILGPYAILDTNNKGAVTELKNAGISDSADHEKNEKQPDQASSSGAENISPELLGAMERIACHSISEQRKLLAVQNAIAGNPATDKSTFKSDDLNELKSMLGEVLASVKALDTKPAANVKELEEKISRIKGR